MCLISQANCAIQQVAIHTFVQGCVFIVSVGGIQEEYIWVPVGGPGRCYHTIYQLLRSIKETKRSYHKDKFFERTNLTLLLSRVPKIKIEDKSQISL